MGGCLGTRPSENHDLGINSEDTSCFRYPKFLLPNNQNSVRHTNSNSGDARSDYLSENFNISSDQRQPTTGVVTRLQPNIQQSHQPTLQVPQRQPTIQQSHQSTLRVSQRQPTVQQSHQPTLQVLQRQPTVQQSHQPTHQVPQRQPTVQQSHQPTLRVPQRQSTVQQRYQTIHQVPQKQSSVQQSHQTTLTTTQQQIIPPTPKFVITEDLLPVNWNIRRCAHPLQDHKYPQKVMLNEGHEEYEEIQYLFRRSMKNRKLHKIIRIERVENPFLWLMYQLKKEEMETLHGPCKEQILFHGTKSTNINNIVINNLNWRMFGANFGHKFGQGVSFSPLASYASHYTDKKHKGQNKMIAARVLVGSECYEGNINTILPSPGFQTTSRPDGKVKVKYDDHTFYPEYIITYSGYLPHFQQNLKNTHQSM